MYYIWHETIKPFHLSKGEDAYGLRNELKLLTWEKIGVVRSRELLEQSLSELNEMDERAKQIKVSGARRYNMEWNEALNILNLITVAKMIAKSALMREESRGSHYRSDFPEIDNKNWLKNICLIRDEKGDMRLYTRPVILSRIKPDDIT